MNRCHLEDVFEFATGFSNYCRELNLTSRE